MEGTLDGDVVRVGPPARERYYDSRGYGRPRGDGLDLARVEAAHLLYRGDLDAVDGRGFRGFLSANADVTVTFLVYTDLRERGFYLSPSRDGWVSEPRGDLVAYERGSGPWDGEVAHRVWTVGERASLCAGDLVEIAFGGDASRGGVLSVVDEESEITYLELGDPEIDGATTFDPPSGVDAVLVGDRVVCWHPPENLHQRGFYGQPLTPDADDPDDADAADTLQLSLLEAAYLADRGVLTLDAGAVRERGRSVEGRRFDRRLAVYRTLRDRGVVPKTGFKFGADFRTYDEIESVEELGHSERLVRVVAPEHEFAPRDLSLDVRLAHGVRKRMVYALVEDIVDGDGHSNGVVTWLAVERLTP